jgi:hypothetical protein
MVRTENFGFRLSPEEKGFLLALAEHEERDPSDLLRLLIRRAARERGLTSPVRESRTDSNENNSKSDQSVDGA